jgi:hypothetical protein
MTYEKWSMENILYIEENYAKYEYKTIGIHLNKSMASVRNKCWRLGLRKKVLGWTEEEVKYLEEQYNKEIIDLDKISRALNRHKTNVSRKAREIGLTNKKRNKSPLHTEKIKQKAINWLKTHEHPKGYLGHTHSIESKSLISQKAKEYWAQPDCPLRSEESSQRRSNAMHINRMEGKMRTCYSRGSMGKREDLGGLYVRSSWEANYCRYLNWLIAQGQITKWEYEPDIFEFTKIKRGCRSYLPDFKITNLDGSIEYHEVKGWMDTKSITKLSRMAKYYPEIKLIIIAKDEYYAIRNSVKSFIPEWE